MNKKGITSCVLKGKYLLCFLPFLVFTGCDIFKTNSPPVITSSPTTQINENNDYEYIIQATDPDEDALTYTLEVKPAWLSLSGHTISGSAPEVESDQTYSVKVKVSDGEEFDTQQFTITVKNVPGPNHAPQITSTPPAQVNENTYYEYYIQATDEDDDRLSYSITSGPSWLMKWNNKIYGTTPEVSQDSTVSVSVRVSDGTAYDDQTYDLAIIDVPNPTVSQTATLSGDIDIEYTASLKDVTSATREVYCNDNKIDSLTIQITDRHYSEVLENNKKGEWKFVLSADGATTDEVTVEVSNYNPTCNVSGLEGLLNFEQGERIAIALPIPTDKNPEDNPVKYSGVESLDGKVSYRIIGDSLYVTNKKGAIGNYSIKLNFGNGANGEGEATINGEITPSVINYFNPFKRPVKGTYHYGSGDANQDGFIDSLDTEAISNGVQNDEADVNGSGIVDFEDGQLLESYLGGDLPYLPGDYDKLQTKAERDSWVDKMLAIDPVSEMPYIDGDDSTRWISGNYASQTCINFFGYDDEIPWEKYSTISNRRFNLPVYYIASMLYDSQGNFYGGHGMNGTFTGDNVFEPSDLNAIEPQNDNTNIQPGGWDITSPGVIYIHSPNYFPNDMANKDMLRGDLIIIFEIDNEGNISYYPNSVNENLVTERP